MTEGIPSDLIKLIKNPEKEFDPMVDATPLEHLLIASSFKLDDGAMFGMTILEQRRDLASNREFMLRPRGWTDDPKRQAEIRERRSSKRVLFGLPMVFRLPREALLGYYQFNMSLSELNEDGMTSNRVTFQLTKGGVALQELSEEDKRVLREIALFQVGKGDSLFALSKDFDRGTVTLTYLPVEQTP